MAKLHEVIAVEGSLLATARKINEESIRTLGKRDENFISTTRMTSYFAEEDQKLNTEESRALVTTVAERLLYGSLANIRAMDAHYQKEEANTRAFADIEVDGVKLVEHVPAVVLLNLENRLSELRSVYEATPTLAPGPNWVPDPAKGPGIYRASDPDVTFRTKRILKPIVMHPATKEHPAQVQAVNEDIPVARIETHQWSSMLTPAQKSELLGRIDKLIRAVKRARQRANEAPVEKNLKLGESLFKFIHGGTI